jgi:hypothetical protein
MARKRNPKRTDPTTSLIRQLRDELCVPEIPDGWMAASTLAQKMNLDIQTLNRRMKLAGYPRKKFKVPGMRAASVWCYQLTK